MQFRQGACFYFGKNALSILAFLVELLKICVAANGALRFSCVVPFGAAHFFIIKKKGERKWLTQWEQRKRQNYGAYHKQQLRRYVDKGKYKVLNSSKREALGKSLKMLSAPMLK